MIASVWHYSKGNFQCRKIRKRISCKKNISWPYEKPVEWEYWTFNVISWSKVTVWKKFSVGRIALNHSIHINYKRKKKTHIFCWSFQFEQNNEWNVWEDRSLLLAMRKKVILKVSKNFTWLEIFNSNLPKKIHHITLRYQWLMEHTIIQYILHLNIV